MNFGTKAILDSASKIQKYKREIDEIKEYDKIVEYIKDNFGELEQEKTVDIPNEDAYIKIKVDDKQNISMYFVGQNLLLSKTFFNNDYFNSVVNEDKFTDEEMLKHLAKENVDELIDKEELSEKILNKLLKK